MNISKEYLKLMPTSEQKILEEVEFFNERFFTYDLPLPFCGLSIFPVKMTDYNDFMASTSCLLLNKNDDPAGIRMTNLDYLLSKIHDEKEGAIWSYRLTKIVELCFHIKPGFKCSKCNHFLSYDEYIKVCRSNIPDEEKLKILICPQCGDQILTPSLDTKKDETGKKSVLVIDGHDIDNTNFNRMRKFILYQNLPDYKDDAWVDKSIRDDQAARNEIESRNSGTATIERKMLCLSAKTNYKINEIYDLTIRKFTMLLSIVNDAMEYEISKTGLMSGMVSLKKGQTLEHWIYKKENGFYGKSVDMDSLVNQIQGS